MDRLFSALVVMTVALTVTSLGLVLTSAGLRRALRGPVLGLALAVNVVVVPVLSYGVAALLPLTPAQTTGVVLVSVGAGGALGLKTVQLARRGDVALALAVVVLLEVIDVAALPLWVRVVAPHGSFDPAAPLRSAVLMVLVPLAIGVGFARLAPGSAPRVSRWLDVAGTIALAAVLVTGVSAYAAELRATLASWVMLAAILIGLLAIVVGAVAARVGQAADRTVPMLTVARFSSLGLVVVDRTFAVDRGVHGAAVGTALVLLVISVGYALVVRSYRRSAAPVTAAVVGS